MKKIIVAVAVVLTTGILTIVTRDNSVKTPQTAQIATAFEKNVTATCD